MSFHGMERARRVLAGDQGPDTQGAKKIGYWCTLVPVELISASGMTPHLIQGNVRETPDGAEGVLTKHMCGWIRSCFDAGLKGKYDFLAGLIVPHACNNMDPMHSMWRRYTKVPWVTLLNTPHVVTKATRAYFHGELESLLDQLEHLGEKTVTQDDLRKAIRLHNEVRASLRDLALLKRERPPVLRGSEMLDVARAVRMLPPSQGLGLAAEVEEEVTHRKVALADVGPRVMVFGMDLDSPELVALIESTGASVVMGYFCPDARSYWKDVPDTDDPLDGLVAYYLGGVQCSRLYEDGLNTTVALAKDLCAQFAVDGCIYPVYRYCDTFESDVPHLNELLTKFGVPGLVLETDYSMNNNGAMKTRIEAFIENLPIGTGVHSG